jgi:hypothetical protein
MPLQCYYLVYNKPAPNADEQTHIPYHSLRRQGIVLLQSKILMNHDNLKIPSLHLCRRNLDRRVLDRFSNRKCAVLLHTASSIMDPVEHSWISCAMYAHT